MGIAWPYLWGQAQCVICPLVLHHNITATFVAQAHDSCLILTLGSYTIDANDGQCSRSEAPSGLLTTKPAGH